jgi:hypothetical protein
MSPTLTLPLPLGSERDLVFNMNQIGSVVDKETATTVHLFFTGLASGIIETAFGGADEVVDGHALAWKEIIFLEIAITFVLLGHRARSSTSLLLAIHARGTLGMGARAGSFVFELGPFAGSKGTGPEQ